MTRDEDLAAVVTQLTDRLLAGGYRVAVAESCTGGWIAKALTDVSGSSQWFEAGLVCYSNSAKQRLAGVSSAALDAHGAVSAATAGELATGVVERSGADLGMAVTGIAGPSGGTPDKPVGLVWFGWSGPNGRVTTRHEVFAGDREAVRRQTVLAAVAGMSNILDNEPR